MCPPPAAGEWQSSPFVYQSSWIESINTRALLFQRRKLTEKRSRQTKQQQQQHALFASSKLIKINQKHLIWNHHQSILSPPVIVKFGYLILQSTYIFRHLIRLQYPDRVDHISLLSLVNKSNLWIQPRFSYSSQLFFGMYLRTMHYKVETISPFLGTYVLSIGICNACIEQVIFDIYRICIS